MIDQIRRLIVIFRPKRPSPQLSPRCGHLVLGTRESTWHALDVRVVLGEVSTRDSLARRTLLPSPWYMGQWDLCPTYCRSESKDDLSEHLTGQMRRPQWRSGTGLGGQYLVIDDRTILKRSSQRRSGKGHYTTSTTSLHAPGRPQNGCNRLIMQASTLRI